MFVSVSRLLIPRRHLPVERGTAGDCRRQHETIAIRSGVQSDRQLHAISQNR